MFLSKLKNKKEVISWSLFDFANQPFSTIIVTFIYGAFFTKHIVADQHYGTLLWSTGISLTAIVVSLFSPILGALADRGGYRKFFLFFFTWVSAIFSIILYFPDAGDIYFALIVFIIANISFEISTVFCNSYLPDLTCKDNIGKVSGFAWGLGFFGGLSALFLSLYLFPDLKPEEIKRINILVGVWFILFSLPTFLFLKDRKAEKYQKRHLVDSIGSLKKTFRDVIKYRTILKFLISRLFYNDGLITIFAMGGIYAVETLDFTFEEVMILGIVLNIAAGVGSFVFGFLEDKIGVKRVINISLYVLIIATLIAFFSPETNFSKEYFWFAGILIGLMIGPNQSSSRSLMSQLTPKEKQNEFFGFFALTGKATSFLGPLIFGVITNFYSQQLALWVVIVFFLIGLFLFNRIDFTEE
tara:strand:+ start:1417 stop:2655 length:1239 start_codon:yes stop_codon:yes gene_type:complete